MRRLYYIRIPFWVPLIIAQVATLTVFTVKNTKHIKAVSEDAMLTRELFRSESEVLEGMYCVKSLGDGKAYSTAEVSCDEDRCNIVVYSDFSPVTVEAVRLSDGTLFCETLGEGRVTYKPSTGTVRITFIKGGKEICEFLK